MNASIQSLLNDIFYAKRQYQIPVYQRNYDWNIEQCQELYDDIVMAIKLQKKHFLGTFVQYKLDNNQLDIYKYIIIDGQQRYTSVYLFLKALYDLCADSNIKEDILTNLFNKSSVNIYGYDEKVKLKLKAVKNDDIQLNFLMNDNFDAMSKESNIYLNYIFFKNTIRKNLSDEYTIKKYLYGLGQLTINLIELSQDDDPQTIFDRINSTGKPLDLKDKVRNYLLMNEEKAEELFNKYWEPIEGLLQVENVNYYIESFLKYKINNTSSKKIDYHTFKTYAENKKNEDILKDLEYFSKYYNAFINGDDTYGKEVNEVLKYFRDLKQTTIYVLFYDLFDDYNNGIIKQKTLIETLKFFLNYTIRRLITGSNSNSLRGLYKTLYKRVFGNCKKEDNAYYNNIIAFMSKQYTSDKVPSDDDFCQRLKEVAVYRNNGKLARILLSIIENGFNQKELVHLDNAVTIEHIMPQNKNNKWWQNHIGENFEIIYIKYLHTLGNLTLSGYNGELSDKSFFEKVNILKKNSKFHILNNDIINCSKWTEDEIKNRASRLSDIILDRLSLPSIFNNSFKKDTNIITEHTLDDKYNYTGENFLYYIFLENTVEVNSQRDFLIKALDSLYQYNKNYFIHFAEENKNIITRDKKLRDPKQIGDTGFYVETNVDANRVVAILRNAFSYFNLPAEDLLFYTESKN